MNTHRYSTFGQALIVGVLFNKVNVCCISEKWVRQTGTSQKHFLFLLSSLCLCGVGDGAGVPTIAAHYVTGASDSMSPFRLACGQRPCQPGRGSLEPEWKPQTQVTDGREDDKGRLKTTTKASNHVLRNSSQG